MNAFEPARVRASRSPLWHLLVATVACLPLACVLVPGEVQYACANNAECSEGLVCSGVEWGDNSQDLDPDEFPHHCEPELDSCFYSYCQSADEPYCGYGICPADKLCVAALIDGEVVFHCASADCAGPYGAPCPGLGSPDCGGQQFCVLSFPLIVDKSPEPYRCVAEEEMFVPNEG